MILVVSVTAAASMGFAVQAKDSQVSVKKPVTGQQASVKKMFDSVEDADLQALAKWPAAQLKSAVNQAGETLLIRAVVTEKTSLAVQLIEKNWADVAAVDASGNDALLYAVTQSEDSLVKALLKAKAPLDRVYDEGKENLLFQAVRNGDRGIIDQLLVARPQLGMQSNSKGQGVIEVSVEAAQLETALHLYRIHKIQLPSESASRARLQNDLKAFKKNKAATELLKLLAPVTSSR